MKRRQEPATVSSRRSSAGHDSFSPLDKDCRLNHNLRLAGSTKGAPEHHHSEGAGVMKRFT
ncbi:hypothetical protein NDU88_007125, partial [Pleurodeles waltl]